MKLWVMERCREDRSERVVCRDGTDGSVWRERLLCKLLELLTVEEGVE